MAAQVDSSTSSVLQQIRIGRDIGNTKVTPNGVHSETDSGILVVPEQRSDESKIRALNQRIVAPNGFTPSLEQDANLDMVVDEVLPHGDSQSKAQKKKQLNELVNALVNALVDERLPQGDPRLKELMNALVKEQLPEGHLQRDPGLKAQLNELVNKVALTLVDEPLSQGDLEQKGRVWTRVKTLVLGLQSNMQSEPWKLMRQQNTNWRIPLRTPLKLDI